MIVGNEYRTEAQNRKIELRLMIDRWTMADVLADLAELAEENADNTVMVDLRNSWDALAGIIRNVPAQWAKANAPTR